MSGHTHPPVHDARIERVGQEVLADALGEVGAGSVARVHRPLGVGADDRDLGLHPLEVAPDAGDRAAGADAGDEHVDLAVGLGPDLRAGDQLVGLGVDLVEVLVRLEGAGDLAREPFRDRVVGLRGLPGDRGRGDHHLGPVGAQQRDLLGAHLVGHHEDAAVPADRGGDREAVPGVARGRLDDRAARAEQAAPLGVFDHPDPDPILDRAAGVEHLELREDRRREAAADRVQPDQGRVAHRVQEGFQHLHPSCPLAIAA